MRKTVRLSERVSLLSFCDGGWVVAVMVVVRARKRREGRGRQDTGVVVVRKRHGGWIGWRPTWESVFCVL